MRILLAGSTGFIGHTLQAALEAAGHTVHGGASPRSAGAQPGRVPMDFARDTTAAAWLPRLQGIDAVVNAVGVLRDTRARPIDAVHRDTPIALFDACAQAGVRRVVQISALGIDGSDTRYAQTKRAAETHLQALAAQGVLRPAILRPSVVYGKGGDSSALFMNLARLPVALFPGLVLRLPQLLTHLSARLGDAVPQSPWCSETLAMLGSDNVGNPVVFEQLLGRPGVHYSQLVATAWR